jgi:ComF family protein
MLGVLARATLDLLLPPSCVGCDTSVAAPGQLCGACFQRIGFIAEPLCGRCGLPFASVREAGPLRTCATCLAAPPPWGRARAAMLYDEAAKGLILPFKHADRTENAATLAAAMHRAGAALLAGADLLVPVPLHRRRLLQRRYNQSALLAAALAKRSGVPSVPDMLARTRATATLGAHTAAERAAILEGAIVVRPAGRARLAGRRVVLIDDVLTSGATARACVRALLDAGAANADVLVASRVADPRSDRTKAQTEDDDADD